MPPPHPVLRSLAYALLAAGAITGHECADKTVPKHPGAEDADTGPRVSFDVAFEEIQSDAFAEALPEERIAYYRAMLADAESLPPADRQRIQDPAAYVVTRLARTLEEQDDVVAALRELRHGRSRWSDCGPDWQAAMSFREARALQRVGVLDMAEELFAAAVRKVDEAVADPDAVNVGGYFNAHLGSVEYKLYVNRFDEALDELERFAAGVDWTWVESRIGSARTLHNKARIVALRAHARARIDDEPSRQKAFEAFEALYEHPGVSPATLFAAGATLMTLRLEDDRDADLSDVLALMEESLERFDEHGLVRDAWTTLAETTARARCRRPGEDAALIRLRESLEEFLDFVRDNPLPGGVAASRYEPFRAAVELLIDASPPEDCLPLLIEWQTVGRLWRALGKPRPSAEDVVATLCDEESGVLVYVRGELEDRWVAIDGKATTVHAVPRRRGWQESALEFQALLETSPERMSPGRRRARPDRLEDLARELATLLFPERLRARLSRWKQLYFVGREELSGLSLEALPVLGETPLGCSHAVVDLPSLAVAPALAGRAARAREARTVRLVADPLVPEAIAQDYGIAPRLGLAPAPLRTTLGLETQGPTLLHEQATPAALNATEDEGVLHLLVHGLRDPYRELTILLALTPDERTPDGLLGVAEIRDVECAPLVLLSVCSGASSPPRSGDAGANHLGGAFVEAGAHTVVLSPGEVHLDASLALYRSLYGSLYGSLHGSLHAERSRGWSSAEAARRARVALRESSGFDDPFHWAQVRVFGIGR